MSHISRQTQKELDQELKILGEYPIMKPKGDTIIPAATFLTRLVEAGSLENLQKRMPDGDISFAYYTEWADGYKAIDREVEKNKGLNNKIKQAPENIGQFVNCVSLTLRLTKKAEDLGKYVPDTKKWHTVANEYKELYKEIQLIDAEYAKIFLEDITKPIYVETPEAHALAKHGHYQALNYIGQYHQQQSLSPNLDAEAVKKHNTEANQFLQAASSKGSNDAMQLIGAKAIKLEPSLVTTQAAMEIFRVNYEIAARRGHSVARVGLGFSLLHKHKVITSKTKQIEETGAKIDHALNLLYRAAKDDATMAHVHLAGYYYTQKMIDKAIEHYEKAVRNEHVPSMLFLARIYMEQSQEGNDKTDLVLNYFKMAMATGNIEARFHIATIYSNTTEWLAKYRNHVSAFTYAFTTAQFKFEEIADKDQRQFVTFAKILLGDFYRDGTTADGKKDNQKAIEWYKAGVQDFEKHPDAFAKAPEEIKLAYYQLGLFYTDLSGEPNSVEALREGLEYLKRAAKLGHIPSMQIQTRLFEDSLTEVTAENALERIRMHEIIATQAFLEDDGTLAILERKKIAAIYASSELNPKPDYKKAIQIYNTLINSHQDVEAAYILARMYEDGKTESGEADLTTATRYYMLCVKYDQSSNKKYTRLAYFGLSQIAARGSKEKKPSYKVAAMYCDKIIALKDPLGYVHKGLLRFKTDDPECPPDPVQAVVHFREAKKLGHIFTPEDLNEISEEIEKFRDTHPEAHRKAAHYDYQLLLDHELINKLLNEITTTVEALLVYPPFLIADTCMTTEDRANYLDLYLTRLIEIGTAYKNLPHTEESLDIMIEVENAIDACANALNKPEIHYPANKNLVRLHLGKAKPDFVEIKRCLNLLIERYQDPESAYNLGQMEEMGQNESGQPDYQAAIKAYELGIREMTPTLPTVQCYIGIGNLAYAGKGMPDNKPDLKYALNQYLTVANMGYFHAYVLIGLLYLTDTDPRMPVNIDLAMHWLRRADDQYKCSPDVLDRTRRHLDILKDHAPLKASYTKAVSYDIRFLENDLWLSDLFFSPGCKPSDTEISMIPQYIKWIEIDKCLDNEHKDRDNLLSGFDQYYKSHLPIA